MTRLLANCFGLDVQTFEKWSLEEATGCLGQELKLVLERTCSVSIIVDISRKLNSSNSMRTITRAPSRLPTSTRSLTNSLPNLATPTPRSDPNFQKPNNAVHEMQYSAVFSANLHPRTRPFSSRSSSRTFDPSFIPSQSFTIPPPSPNSILPLSRRFPKNTPCRCGTLQGCFCAFIACARI
jgi:hypothetical protein